jgi:hypothetical protein
MKKRQQLQRLRLPSYVVDALSKLALCDCGRPAKHVGVFYLVMAGGRLRQDAMLLCDECAQQIDAGVTVTPLE